MNYPVIMVTEIFYPAFISLKNKNCLVCGYGAVGRRKAAGLLAANAKVTVLDPFIIIKDFSTRSPEDAPGEIIFEGRSCLETDIQRSFLVFAATNDAAENSRITALCHKHRVLCNCATDAGLGDFIVPSVARAEPLAAALSTSGASPLLARKWRAELDDWLKPRASFAWLMGKLRPLLIGADSAENAGRLAMIVDSPIQEWLSAGDTGACQKWFASNMPEISQDNISRVLAEFENVFAG